MIAIEVERGIHPQQVPGEATLVSPEQDSSQRVTEEHPAARVMTDLKVVTPFQIDPAASLDEVGEKMVSCGVRLLFVSDQENRLLGLITSTDILGEKPVLYVNEHRVSRDSLKAKHVMTPLNKLEAIPFTQVERASVGDVVAALKDCRRHHMLVLESREECDCVRGIFSITQVGRQLGTEINPSLRANSFSQIRKVMAQ